MKTLALSNRHLALMTSVLSLIMIGACDNAGADAGGDDTSEASGGNVGAGGGRKNGSGAGGTARGTGGKSGRGTGGEGMGGELDPGSGGVLSGGGSSGGSKGETPAGGSGGLGGAAPSGGAAASGGEGSGGAPAITNHTCTAKVAATSAFAIPCPVAGSVRHVRIEGLVASSFHGSSQLLFGFSSAPESSQPATDEGQLRVLFYGGGPGGSPNPQLVVYAGDEESTLSSAADFLHQSSAVCLDLHPGSETLPPHVVLWRDGEKGADCGDWDTLTLESAWAREVYWGGAEVSSILDSQVFFRQPGGDATVTVFDASALDLSAFLPLECSQEVTISGSFVDVACAFEGPVRHVKIEDLLSPMHGTTQLVFGFAEAPTAASPAVAAGQFRALFYGGQTDPATASISANYAGNAVTYAEGASSIRSGTTACFDLHDGDATRAPSFVLWLTGVNGADCNDPEALTLDTAFAKETTFSGSTGAVELSAPIFFRKTATENTTVTLRGAPMVSPEAFLPEEP